MADSIKREPLSDQEVEYQTFEESQVGAQADNESRLQYMMDHRKKANVYKVKTKEELFGTKPAKAVNNRMTELKVAGQKRAHIIDTKAVPTRLAKRARTMHPEVTEPTTFPSDDCLVSAIGVYKDTFDTLAVCVCVVAGIYLLVKYKNSGKEVVEAVLEGSSMEV